MKPKITKLIKLLSLFVIFVVVIKGQSSVDSSKYVWVDYSQVNLINETVIQSKDVFYRVNIPCKTSI